MTKLLPWLGRSLFLTMAGLVTIAAAEQGREPLKVGVIRVEEDRELVTEQRARLGRWTRGQKNALSVS